MKIVGSYVKSKATGDLWEITSDFESYLWVEGRSNGNLRSSGKLFKKRINYFNIDTPEAIDFILIPGKQPKKELKF
jgi:hypothetical protein